LTMLPPPAVRRWGTACLVHRNTAVVLTAITRSHSALGNSWVGTFRPETPALLTSTSSRPCRATTSARVAATASSSVTSHRWKLAPFPAAEASTSTTATAAPSWAIRVPIAAPMPLPPPVTTATFPLSRTPHLYQAGCWTRSAVSAMIGNDDHPGVPDAGHAGAAARGAGVVGGVQVGRHPRDRRGRRRPGAALEPQRQRRHRRLPGA